MNRVMIAVLTAFVCVVPGLAQNQWEQVKIQDPIKLKIFDRFSLEGEYLETPRASTPRDTPKLVILCTDGKIVRNFGLVRTLLPTSGVKIDYRIGDKRRTILAKAENTRDKAITLDDSSRTFGTFDFDKLLADVLKSGTVVMSVRDDSASRSTVLNEQLLMQFDLPDLTPLLGGCGQDKALKGVSIIRPNETRSPISSAPAAPSMSNPNPVSTTNTSVRRIDQEFQKLFDDNRGSELGLSQAGEEAFTLNEYDWAIRFLEQAKLVGRSGVWQSNYPFLAASYVLSPRKDREAFETTLREMIAAMTQPGFLRNNIPRGMVLNNLTRARRALPSDYVLP